MNTKEKESKDEFDYSSNVYINRKGTSSINRKVSSLNIKNTTNFYK